MSYDMHSLHVTINKESQGQIESEGDVHEILDQISRNDPDFSFVYCSSNNGIHISLLIELAPNSDKEALAFLEKKFHCLSPDEIVAAIHALTKICADIINDSVDPDSLDIELAKRPIWKLGDPELSEQDYCERAYLQFCEAKAVDSINVQETGYQCGVELFSYLKSLLQHLVNSMLKGQSSLYYLTD